MSLTTEYICASEFSDALVSTAYALYRTCYAPTDKAVFERDFFGKSYAIVIRDESGLVGFSTVERIEATQGARVLFSGDTVIDPRHWGSQALAYAWLRHAGRIWTESAERPLYWMLITKGHRTYRYLPAFSRQYFPSPDWPTPPEVRAFMDQLAHTRFADRYDKANGTVRASAALPTRVVGSVEGGRSNRYAAFFAERNPGYRQGDELLTLCRLAPDALTPRGRRQFLKEVATA